MIQTAGLHLNDDFAGPGLRIGHFAEFKLSRRAVGDELESFHDFRFTIYD